MTFSAIRIASPAAKRRALLNGVALPVMQSFNTIHAGTNSFTVTKPSGTIDGDLLFLHATIYGANAVTQGTGGWTELWGLSIVEGARSTAHYGYWRIVQSGDTSWVFNIAGGNTDHATICYRVDGHDPATPVADSDTKSQSGTTSQIIIPAIESAITNCLLLHLVAKSDVLSGTITPPGGAETVDHNDDQGNIQHLGAHEDFTAGGGTGTRTYGMSHTVETNFGALVLVQPVAGDPDKLEFESTTDNLLFEDSSGVLLLET